MAKAPERKPEQVDHAIGDWFLTAIEHDGPVAACLDAVSAELRERSDFIAAVRANLTMDGSSVDSVTDLGQKIRALENTLRFRLPMLSPDRPSAWFRAPAATTTGPFQAALLSEPVFAHYEPEQAAQIEQALVQAWQSRQQQSLPFSEGASCLWLTLLQHNARLEQLCQLPLPFANLRLDTLPEGLPASLQTRSLASFLLNVRTELLMARDRLAGCYQQLRETSLQLWSVQRRQAAEREKQRQHTYRGAQDIRDEFRRRRSHAATKAAAILAPADIEAMRFMGFAQLPEPTQLRQRYLAMAKKLHPDRQGGDDQAFKLLVNAYSRLTSRVEA